MKTLLLTFVAVVISFSAFGSDCPKRAGGKTAPRRDYQSALPDGKGTAVHSSSRNGTR